MRVAGYPVMSLDMYKYDTNGQDSTDEAASISNKVVVFTAACYSVTGPQCGS